MILQIYSHKYCSLIVVVLDEILLTGQLRHIRFLWSYTNPAWRCFSIHKGRRAEAGILGHITLSLNKGRAIYQRKSAYNCQRSHRNINSAHLLVVGNQRSIYIADCWVLAIKATPLVRFWCWDKKGEDAARIWSHP